ncbi:Ubiquitin-conjugating enzyme domain containing protein [Aphelenchoides besseyi]|nr:Ubiquitin-conjugating enzyme domain containing protein [Aphelenchoides besseyi]KAI6207353.1 Ubiquitin-conjugating enzyme domain containing protein [Aphelenchoides besseyi]
MAATNRRLQKEISDVRAISPKLARVIDINESNMLNWQLLLLPTKEPYNKGAFKITITFPVEYPFKPPKIVFNTQIYHPNVDEKGQVCLGVIAPNNWKPATRIAQVIHSLLDLIGEPELDHPLRSNLAEDYRSDKSKFFKAAEDATKKLAEKRPE